MLCAGDRGSRSAAAVPYAAVMEIAFALLLLTLVGTLIEAVLGFGFAVMFMPAAALLVAPQHAVAVSLVLTLWLVRGGLRANPGRTQTVVELIYTFSETNIGQATLPKAWTIMKHCSQESVSPSSSL